MILRNPICCRSNQFFSWINGVHHLWSNLKTCKHFFVEKSLNVSNVELLSMFFQQFLIFLIPFCFQALSKGEKYPFAVFYFLLLETAPKTQNISKFTKEQEMFAKWTIDGVQHQFNKNWKTECSWGFLRSYKNLEKSPS